MNATKMFVATVLKKGKFWTLQNFIAQSKRGEGVVGRLRQLTYIGHMPNVEEMWIAVVRQFKLLQQLQNMEVVLS